MARGREDIKYGTAQAKLSEDEALRIRFKAGTPLEGGKIADAEPLDLFSSAHSVTPPSQPADRGNHSAPTPPELHLPLV
ncbi:SEED MATURATION PROTEIN 1 [Malania oleifera]|uniref:SEED MATURATION PROTEIN 1 n=1 Tax=Malania oleifera TaxID=397392 RepID=UPI0025AE43E4|nr:SEED MATURATION PROTEIN 1 [Malania oleifera]